MPAGVYNIPLIEKGSSYTLECLYKDKNNNPIDLTDFIGRGQIKVSAQSVTPIVNFDVTIPFPKTEGKIIIELSPEKTATIPTRGNSYSELTPYVYDIEIENTNTNEVYRVLNGTVRVSPEITR